MNTNRSDLTALTNLQDRKSLFQRRRPGTPSHQVNLQMQSPVQSRNPDHQPQDHICTRIQNTDTFAFALPPHCYLLGSLKSVKKVSPEKSSLYILLCLMESDCYCTTPSSSYLGIGNVIIININRLKCQINF
jgi:hypothetical protein